MLVVFMYVGLCSAVLRMAWNTGMLYCIDFERAQVLLYLQIFLIGSRQRSNFIGAASATCRGVELVSDVYRAICRYPTLNYILEAQVFSSCFKSKLDTVNTPFRSFFMNYLKFQWKSCRQLLSCASCHAAQPYLLLIGEWFNCWGHFKGV